MPNVTLYSEAITGACGVGILTDFSLLDDDEDVSYYRDELIDGFTPHGGAGFELAGFIDTDACRETYKKLAERFKIVYQSPVRLNKNSYNQFFFVIYDTTQQGN
jgi:hypothetical protein